MEGWMRISLQLCVFGFLKELRPSEPFIFDFLRGPWRHVTEEQIVEEVYPVGTYANLVLLVAVFLVTDMCRYKPLIVALALAGVVVWGMLLWTESLLALQVVEVFYGAFMATEVAYYTYAYAKVDKQHFRRVTSHTRAAVLAGRAASGVASQTLVSTGLMDFRQLNYITFGSMVAATAWGALLPPVRTSVYFHGSGGGALEAFALMRRHFADAFFGCCVLKWSAWWALSTCGYVQVENYMQPLYTEVLDSQDAAYNGAVEFLITLLGFLAALLAGCLGVDWAARGDAALAACSLAQGLLVVGAAHATTVYACYALYIAFGILFHFMVTVASAQIAQAIDQDSYGLIFGINTFVALVFNAILTSAVATKGVGFELAVRDQYVVYGAYHLAICLLFAVVAAANLVRRRIHTNKP